jgi:hypothetical protein
MSNDGGSAIGRRACSNCLYQCDRTKCDMLGGPGDKRGEVVGEGQGVASDKEEMVKKMSDRKGAKPKIADEIYALKIGMELVFMRLTAIEGQLAVVEDTAALGLIKLADFYRGLGDKRGEVVGEGQGVASDKEEMVKKIQ